MSEILAADAALQASLEMVPEDERWPSEREVQLAILRALQSIAASLINVTAIGQELVGLCVELEEAGE